MTYLLRILFVAIGLFLVCNPTFAVSDWENATWVSKEEILAAMQHQRAQGYVIEAIANATRLQSGIFLELADRASVNGPMRQPLRIGHQDYFDALVEATGIAPDLMPTYIKVAHDFHEDYLIDGRMENVIQSVVRGERPRRALNIKVGWPSNGSAPPSYSYEDRSAHPHVEVTHEQVSAYRVLDFGGIIIYDEIRGVTGRATSGVLGLVFLVLGKAQAVQTRFAFAGDGVQVSLTAAKKLHTIRQAVTIYSDGKVHVGVPSSRSDLIALEKALQDLDFEMKYMELELSPVP